MIVLSKNFIVFVILWCLDLFCVLSCNAKIAGPLGGSPYNQPVGNLNDVPPNHIQPLPYALSSVYLTDLAKREETIHQKVLEYAQSLEERLSIVRRYLADYEDSVFTGVTESDVESPELKVNVVQLHHQQLLSHNDSIKEAVKVNAGLVDLDGGREEIRRALKVTASPIRSFRMIRRFAEDFRAIDKHIRDDAEATFLDQMAELQGHHNWPSDDDTYDSIDAILRIHFFYALNITEFVEGKIDGLETGVKLTTQQCWKIAQFAIRWQFYTLALEWIEATRWKLSREKEEDRWPGLSEEVIRATERKTRELHDQHFDEQREKRSPFIFASLIGNKEGPLPQTMRAHLFEHFLGREFGETVDYSFINFVALCNGYNFQNAEEKHDLKCWLETKRHPYFILNPLKMELLHKEPYLVQIYDFMGDQWIEVLKKVASPMLERAPPRNHAKATPRTATYAWLQDSDFAQIDLINKIESLTGINVATEKASERLQIASYTFGGHVGTHVDSLGSQAHLDEKGDRIFTLLVYLNDVSRGGLTAFPVLGTTVKPMKGSAVLWYDSLKNGEVDQRMLHGACPLILGQKWIATKWTHLNENFLKWPCSLNPEE